MMSVRNGVSGRKTATEWSVVISLAFWGFVEWSAMRLAERSLWSEDERTADIAGSGGRVLRSCLKFLKSSL